MNWLSVANTILCNFGKKTHYCNEWYSDDYTKKGLSFANAIFNNFGEKNPNSIGQYCNKTRNA